MKFSKLVLLLITPLLSTGHGAGMGQQGSGGGSQLGMNLLTPLDKNHVLPHDSLRDLQPDPPDLPDFPDLPEEDGEPASYCDFLFLLFDAQANAQGYDCECVSDDEKDTVTCNARSLTCDAYDVGDVDMICHSRHFNSSTTRGHVDEMGYKVFDYAACATYSDAPLAPDNLAGSEWCSIYKLSAVSGQGYNLDECGVTIQAAPGDAPQEVCTCSICSTTVGLLTYWGLGLDCQESLIPGITLVQCQALTDTNPAVIPLIEEYRQDTSDPTDSPTPSTNDPDTTAAATQTGSPVQPSKFPNLSQSMTGVAPLAETSWDTYVKEYSDFNKAFYAANPQFGVSNIDILLEFVSQDPPLTRRLGELPRQLQDKLTLVYNQAIVYSVTPNSGLQPADVVTQPFASQTARDAFAASLRASDDPAFANVQDISGVSQSQPSPDTTVPSATAAATDPGTTVAATDPGTTVAATDPGTTVTATDPGTTVAVTTESPPTTTTPSGAVNAMKFNAIAIVLPVVLLF